MRENSGINVRPDVFGLNPQVLLHQIRAVLDGCKEPESIGSAAPY